MIERSFSVGASTADPQAASAQPVTAISGRSAAAAVQRAVVPREFATRGDSTPTQLMIVGVTTEGSLKPVNRQLGRSLTVALRAGAAIVVGAVVLVGCGREPKKAEAAPAPPVPVHVVAVQEIAWPSVYEATGTVRARISATVAGKTMGYIREMRVKAGDRVAAGQLIAVIDSRDLEAGLQQARAAVDEARSGIAEADNGIAAAKAQLDLATATFKRMRELFDKRSISNQEFDEAKSRLAVAQAGYEMASAKRRQLDARIRQTEQAARGAEVAHSYAEIHAPFAGVVTEKRAEQGDMATPGAPLVVIEQGGGYQLEVPVEEARLGSIRPGQTVTVALDAIGTRSGARVTEVVPAVDPASRSFTVKIALPGDARVRSGMFGRAMFPLGERRAVVVPENAIATSGQVTSVAVVENGIARLRLVSLGDRNNGMLEALSGLTAGDSVIAPRPANLVDGGKVEVRQ